MTRFQPGVESVAYGKEAKRERTDEWLSSVLRYDFDVLSTQTSKFKQSSTSGSKQLSRREPDQYSVFHAAFALFLLVISLTGLAFTVTTSLQSLLSGKVEALLLAGMSAIFLFASLILLCCQPKNTATFPVTIPLFPGLPILSIFLNILLIINLDYWNFARFGAWIILGKIPFFPYTLATTITGHKL